MKVCSTIERDSYFVLFDGIDESSAPGLLLALDEKNKIDLKSAILEEFCGSTGYRHNRPFIIRHPSTIKVTVMARHNERVSSPPFRRG
jgi:hypothetical protein